MSEAELRDAIMQEVTASLGQGPGYAQESFVLKQVGRRLRLTGDLAQEQQLLTAWHRLFREGKLAWGYNLDNPNAPFFHLANEDEN